MENFIFCAASTVHKARVFFTFDIGSSNKTSWNIILSSFMVAPPVANTCWGRWDETLKTHVCPNSKQFKICGQIMVRQLFSVWK